MQDRRHQICKVHQNHLSLETSNQSYTKKFLLPNKISILKYYNYSLTYWFAKWALVHFLQAQSTHELSYFNETLPMKILFSAVTSELLHAAYFTYNLPLRIMGESINKFQIPGLLKFGYFHFLSRFFVGANHWQAMVYACPPNQNYKLSSGISSLGFDSIYTLSIWM